MTRLLTAVLSSCLLFAYPASAQPAPVLVLSESADADVSSVRRELGTLGIESTVIVATPVTGSWVVEVTSTTARREARVWWCTASGVRILRHAVRETSQDDASFPVRVAEAVRAMWTSDGSGSASATNPVASSAPISVAPPRPPTQRLAVHAALSLPNSHLHAAGFAVLSGHWLPLPYEAGLGAVLVLPIVPAQIDHKKDSAEVSASMFGIEATSSVIPETWRRDWQTHASLGMLVQWVRTVGVAAYPNKSVRDSVWSSMPYARVVLGRRLTPSLALQASALVGMAAPPVGIRFEGLTVTNWAQPFCLVAAGVAFDR